MRHYPVTLMIILLAAAGCSEQAAQQPAAATAPEQAVPVYTEELQTSTFRHYVNIQGTVESDRTIQITSRTTAEVESVRVRAGDRVSPGDTLATLDGEVTGSQIAELQTRLDLARTVYERQSNLREDDIGSEIELLRARNQVQSLESQLVTLREQYENYIITAPIGGTVNRVSLKVGENVVAADVLFQIANSEALKVTGELSESYISRIEEGDSVRVTIPGIGYEMNTTLDVVSKVIDPANRTFSVEIYLPGSNGSIRPNMMAQLRINDTTLPEVITIPVNAIQSGNSTQFVYVAEQDGDSAWVARQRAVRTGLSHNDRIVADSGLMAGHLLITRGHNNVEDGDRITIEQQ